MEFPRIIPVKKSGQEKFKSNGKELMADLLSFWQWSGSNLVDNAMRGALAEYIVAMDVGCVDIIRGGWEVYDLESPAGVKIEVKSAAYLQTWGQNKFSSISFSIRKAFGWNAETNEVSTTKERGSEVYVFCVLAEKNQPRVDPLNLDQWEFYVVPTKILNEKFSDQKTISLKGLIDMGAKKLKYGELREEIQKVAGR
jgi:hypothetical protein